MVTNYINTLKTLGALASDNINTGGNDTAVNELGLKFVQWFEQLYYQPIEEKNASWKPAYLEHQFSCSAPKAGSEKVLMADEYYHGHLDWYNLDVHNNKSRLTKRIGSSNFRSGRRYLYAFVFTHTSHFPGHAT